MRQGPKFRVGVIKAGVETAERRFADAKGERRKKKIFRDCTPIFYHWAEG